MILPAINEPLELRRPPSTLPVREMALPEVWRMLRKRKPLILVCAIACLLLAILYVLIKGPRYQASARIELSPVGTNALGLDEMNSKILSPSDPTIQLQSAATILQSTTIALDVMQQMRMAERKDFAGSWMQAAGTTMSDIAPEARDQLLYRFRKSLRVEIVPKTDIITVQFRTKDPKLAADVVNATVNSYTERNFRSSYDSATQVSEWLSRQMDDLRLKANSAQEQLADLQRRRGLIGVDETDNTVIDKLKGIDEQLTWAEADRVVKEARFRIAASGNPELMATLVPEPTLQALRSQQAQLSGDYARMNAKFGDGYPKLAELGSQIAQVEEGIQSELRNLGERYRNEYVASADAEKMLRAKFEAQKQRAYDLNQGAAQYAILKHEVQATQDLYQTLQLKLQQAGIVAGLASANVAVVEAGEIPSEPVDPRPLLDIALGFSAGLGLGVVSALALEAIDGTLKSSEEAESIAGLPVLAIIPEIRHSDAEAYFTWLQLKEEKPAFRMIALHEPVSPAAESYRFLRTSLHCCGISRPPQVLVVTSSLPAEGKSLTAINCATVLAQQGARVLLVDADMRRPCLHQEFKIPQEPGLSSMLSGTDGGKIGAFAASGVGNLLVVPSGHDAGSPADLLASKAMKELVEGWRGRYDYIVMDTPPVSMFTDAVVLSPHADAFLLVTRCGVTTHFALRHSCEVLQRANASVVGLLFNGADLDYQNGYQGFIPGEKKHVQFARNLLAAAKRFRPGGMN